MISVMYVSFSAILIIWLSLNVIKHRRAYQVSVGDGDNEKLRLSIAAQSNAIEYIPIALLLLLALEYNGAHLLLVHLLGILLITGRLMHAKGLLSANLQLRVLGMQVTFFVIIALAVLNIVYLPFAKLINF